MLKCRIIPKLLLKNGRNVKGVRFAELRDVGHPVSNARIYDAQGADELLFLDITASAENRGLLYDAIRRAAQEVFMPFCVGGGIRTIADIRQLLLAGADKVAINTSCVTSPSLVADAAQLFGAQCIVVSIDYRARAGWCEVYTHGGTAATGLSVCEHARRVVALGAGELLLTSVERDGTMRGYDLDVTRTVADSVDVPVIVSGGAGTLQHLVDGVRDGHASAVAVGSLFHFTDQSPIKARAFMRVAGVDVRVEFPLPEEVPMTVALHLPVEALSSPLPVGPLAGPRLFLREVRETDVNEAYHRWMNDPEVTCYLESRFFPLPQESLLEYVRKMRGDRDNLFLAIVLRNGAQHIGNIKLGPINWIHRSGDIGLLIGEKTCWGQGYATEAIRCVAAHAFAVLNLHKLTASCYHTNVGSARAFLKAGFAQEGVRRSQFFSNGDHVDQVMLGAVQPAPARRAE